MSGVKDSHRTLTELVGAARDAFGDDLTARQQAGLVRFEQEVARRTLRGTARAGAWALGFGVVAAGAAAAGPSCVSPTGRRWRWIPGPARA